MNIYSRINPTELLHIINRKAEIKPGRMDLVEANQFIQVASISQPKGHTFKPHRHITYSREEVYITQESWIIISGIVKVTFYDLDNTVLHVDVLEPGDCSITLQGGHNYEFIQDGLVYEFKTGPYQGQQKDKEFI